MRTEKLASLCKRRETPETKLKKKEKGDRIQEDTFVSQFRCLKVFHHHQLLDKQ